MKETFIRTKKIATYFLIIALLFSLLIFHFTEFGIGTRTIDVYNGKISHFQVGDNDYQILFNHSDFEYVIKPDGTLCSGGYGKTLEYEDKTYTTYLFWSYNKLGKISLGPKWKGKTESGIRIGDSVEKFLQKYPNAIKTASEDENMTYYITKKDFNSFGGVTLYSIYSEFSFNNGNLASIVVTTDR